MPVPEGDLWTDSERDRPFCPNHGELKFEELRTLRHSAEMVCAVCFEPVEWRTPA
jgi:endogenous inhibitor of DNA gyrase (YacG/DUF329 family)